MTTPFMKMGWGNAIWFPGIAVLVGLSGGFAMGRSLRGEPKDETAKAQLAMKQAERTAEVEAKKPEVEAKKPEVEVDHAGEPDSAKNIPSEASAGTAAGQAAPAKPNAAAAMVAEAVESGHGAPPRPLRKVRVRISSHPYGANVVRADDKTRLGRTPFELKLPVDGQSIELLFIKEGFEPKQAAVIAGKMSRVSVDFKTAAKPKAQAEPRPSRVAAPRTATPAAKKTAALRVSKPAKPKSRAAKSKTAKTIDPFN